MDWESSIPLSGNQSEKKRKNERKAADVATKNIATSVSALPYHGRLAIFEKFYFGLYQSNASESSLYFKPMFSFEVPVFIKYTTTRPFSPREYRSIGPPSELVRSEPVATKTGSMWSVLHSVKANGPLAFALSDPASDNEPGPAGETIWNLWDQLISIWEFKYLRSTEEDLIWESELLRSVF